jgi:sugar O-acyltransferase (sialic acid O-acetyltransferase NeuD family)
MKQKFDKWNKLKQLIQNKEPIPFKQGEIYFMSIGQNIGYEVYGKKELYLRPVLVYKKLSKQTFIGIPLSSKEKEGTYFFTFRYTEKTLSTALLNQIRVFDIKRAEYYDGKIKLSDLGKLKEKLLNLLNITPNPKGKGSGHSSMKLPKDEVIISNINNNVKQDILLVGGGGHCRSVIDVIEQESKYKIAGIIDKKELVGKDVLGYKIIGSDDDLANLKDKFPHAIVTIGQIKSNEIRVKLFKLLKELDFHMPTIVSPLAYVSKHAFVDEGTVIMHHALINPHARVGKNCIINSKALIEHDAIIEDNCHISTASVVNGGTIIKQNTFFGSNAMAKEYIEIKADSVIRGGVSVMKSH